VRLSEKEQRHVRTALRFLRLKVGGWQPLADALGVNVDSIGKVLRGARAVTTKLAFGVARLTDVSIDDLLAGALLSPRTCPHCGRPPDDFTDEETVVEDARQLRRTEPAVNAPGPREFAEHDFEGPYELGHAVFDDEYGVYLLVGVVEHEPAKVVVVYVGRGHFRQQLARHAASGRARYFYLRQFPTAARAFREECRLFHAYGGSAALDNKTHPVVPAGSPTNIPRCHVRGCNGAED
jgi:hypothetical protein